MRRSTASANVRGGPEVLRFRGFRGDWRFGGIECSATVIWRPIVDLFNIRAKPTHTGPFDKARCYAWFGGGLEPGLLGHADRGRISCTRARDRSYDLLRAEVFVTPVGVVRQRVKI